MRELNIQLKLEMRGVLNEFEVFYAKQPPFTFRLVYIDFKNPPFVECKILFDQINHPINFSIKYQKYYPNYELQRLREQLMYLALRRVYHMHANVFERLKLF
jgi:hypothetical protein